MVEQSLVNDTNICSSMRVLKNQANTYVASSLAEPDRNGLAPRDYVASALPVRIPSVAMFSDGSKVRVQRLISAYACARRHKIWRVW